MQTNEYLKTYLDGVWCDYDRIKELKEECNKLAPEMIQKINETLEKSEEEFYDESLDIIYFEQATDNVLALNLPKRLHELLSQAKEAI